MTEKKKKDKKQELEKEAVEKENVTQADTVENADSEGENWQKRQPKFFRTLTSCQPR